MTTDRYNVLIIMSDQHSKHHLGCYGDDLVRTPNLDRLASEGMQFTNAYTPSPVCAPARMSFLTGRRPSANRVWRNHHVLHSGTPTWAHSLGAAGYETALMGKMHFQGPDLRHGFERRPLGEWSNPYPGSTDKGGPRFRVLDNDTSSQARVSVEQAGVGKTTYQAFDEMVTNATLGYLEERASSPGRPFAAFAGYLMPHCPFVAPRELFDYYYPRVDVPQLSPEEIHMLPEPVKNFRRFREIDEPFTEEQIRVARAAYHGMIELLDRQVGLLLQRLDETGLAENTLVLYTTDHGEMAGEHGCWWKSNYYEGAVGVPLIARLPGVVPPSTRNPVLCNLIDVPSTLTEMAGADRLNQQDGHSLWRELQGHRDESRPDETFSELLSSTGVEGADEEAPSRMVRKGPWKLYQYDDGTEPVLFNLDIDPDEVTDLGVDPSYAGVRAELLERLYDGWDPGYARRESERMGADREILMKWARATNPQHVDAATIPDAENVQLL